MWLTFHLLRAGTLSVAVSSAPRGERNGGWTEPDVEEAEELVGCVVELTLGADSGAVTTVVSPAGTAVGSSIFAPALIAVVSSADDAARRLRGRRPSERQSV